MALVSTLQFRRRASRRIIQDLPRDLEDLGLDDPVVLLGKVRELIARDQQFESGKAPYDRRARFGVPSSPSSSRLRSADGFESFHFAINVTRARSAATFDRYATRDAALAADAGRTGPSVDDPEISTVRTANAFDDYALGHGGDANAPPLSITTLDPRADVRRGQWDQVEAHERGQRVNPGGGPPRINLRFEQAPAFLLDAARRNECPMALRDIILAERDRVAAGRDLPSRLQRDGVPWISSDAPHTMAWLKTLPGWEKPVRGRKDAAKLSPGRGTPTVIAGELELPRGLDDIGHRNIMSGLSTFIQQQLVGPGEHGGKAVRDREEPEMVIPVMVVRHWPDRLNNPLNVHVHFQHGTRAASADEDGELSFADTKPEAIAGKGWIRKLRCEAARLMNLELERTQADYRLSPDTYAALGIEAATQTKLRGKRVVLERGGVPTGEGVANIAESWRRGFEQARRDHDAALLALDRRHRKAAAAIRKLEEGVALRLEAERDAAHAEDERAARLRFEAAEIAILVEMALSRPEQTVRFADAFADKAMHADGRDTYAASRWRQRGADAQAHLAMLDVELTGERDAIAERDREASLAQARAAEWWQRIDEAIGTHDVAADRQPAITTTTPERRLSRATAVTLVATTPIYLTKIGDSFIVRPEDDIAGVVQGVDLGTSARLDGVHAAQEKELAQLRAYVRRHGRQALDDAALGRISPWMQRSARKWRDTAAFARMTMADRGLARTHAAFVARTDDDDLHADLRSELPGMLPAAIGRADPAVLARNGVVSAPVPQTVVRSLETVAARAGVARAAAPAVDAGRRAAGVSSGSEAPAPARPFAPTPAPAPAPAQSPVPRLSPVPVVRDRSTGARRQPEPGSVVRDVAAQNVLIPDGFGGMRDGPAPQFVWQPLPAKVIAFDKATKAPTKPLLRLLEFAGRNPAKLVFAQDDRLMTLAGTPAMIAPLMQMWRHDDAVQALVVQTVTASRAAGRPVWPDHLSLRIRDLDPSPMPGRDLSNDRGIGIT